MLQCVCMDVSTQTYRQPALPASYIYDKNLSLDLGVPEPLGLLNGYINAQFVNNKSQYS